MKKNTFADSFRYDYSATPAVAKPFTVEYLDNNGKRSMFTVVARSQTEAIEKLQEYLRSMNAYKAALHSRRKGKSMSALLDLMGRNITDTQLPSSGRTFSSDTLKKFAEAESTTPALIGKINKPTSDISFIYHKGTEGGVTIGWRRGVKGRDCRTIEVAVAYCAKEDVYNKRIGTQLVIRRFEEGKTIKLPISDYAADIYQYLTSMFWLMPVVQHAVK